MTAARPLASRNRKNRRLGERFFGSGVTATADPERQVAGGAWIPALGVVGEHA